MNKLNVLIAAVMAAGSICSAAIIPSESVELTGIDVRDKSGQYVLFLSKENILLEERNYKLMKVVGQKKQLVTQGAAVYSGANLSEDTEAIWVNENTQIKIGRMIGERSPKQVVVFKMKDANRTFAFELLHK